MEYIAQAVALKDDTCIHRTLFATRTPHSGHLPADMIPYGISIPCG